MQCPSPLPPDDAQLLEWALWYARQGWAVFPCYGKKPLGIAVKHGYKEATCDEATIRHWWGQWPQANIGMPVQDGKVVLDTDPRKGGDALLYALQQQYGQLPDTLTSHTGGGGEHYTFTTSVQVKNKADLGDGIDVQGPGSYVIVPPSIHPETGKRYVWDVVYGPESITPQPAPAWLEDLISRQSNLAETTPRDPQAPILEGRRETTLMAIAGAMQRQGASHEAIRSALEVENDRCVPPLEARDLDRMTRSVGRYAPAQRLEVKPADSGDVSTPESTTDGVPGTIPLTDYFNARALVERYGADMRYCKAWRDWMVWTGTSWNRDDMGHSMQWAKMTIMKLFDRMQDCADNKERQALYRHITASLATGRLKALLESASSEPDIRLMPEAFDRHQWLLNCANGTLDLTTGVLRPHRREDLLSKCLALAYDPEATCHTWERFLWHIMGGSSDLPDDPDASAQVHQSRYEADDRARRLVSFLQRAVGYSLTGDTSEHCFFLLYGTGRNGKSTFIETVQAMLGPYGKTAEMSTFLAKQTEGVRDDLADLHGARFVSASEADKGKRLAESLVKRVTGGEKIKARFLYEKHFEFIPQMHVWLAVNDKPTIRGTDRAIWERIRLIPFDVFIPPTARDRHLGAKLKMELPGILAWAVKGCLEWQRYGGLKEPDEVTEATEGYRKEMDLLGQFLAECCITHPELSVKVGTLYKAYESWCTDNGQQAESLTAIGYRLDVLGYPKEPERRKTGWWRTGIGLPVTAEC